MPQRMEIMVGRIERLAVDAVVNAANTHLLPGGGVDGALRDAAGPELTRLTTTMAPIAEGEVVLTPAFNASARAIMHTAAPIWFASGSVEEKCATLAACYRNCILLAEAHPFTSIAFPCLGTGAFAWPRELACDTALEACRAALNGAMKIERVIFCCFSDADAALYHERLV